MNEEQEAALGMLVKDLETKDTDELESYLLVTRGIGLIASTAGIGILLLTMLIPGFLMFIAAGLIVPFAFRVSLTIDRVKQEIKKIIKSRDTDK